MSRLNSLLFISLTIYHFVWSLVKSKLNATYSYPIHLIYLCVVLGPGCKPAAAVGVSGSREELMERPECDEPLDN